MKDYYLPTTIVGRRDWQINFNDKLPTHAATLGVSAAELTQVADDTAMVDYAVRATQQIILDKREFVAYRRLLFNGKEGDDIGAFPTVSMGPAGPPGAVAAGVFARSTELVRKIKAAPGYTVAIGNDLGIIGAEDGFDPNTFQTTLSAIVRNNAVRIGFTGVSKVDSMVFYARLKGENAWEKIGVADTSPFIDTRPLENPNRPEVREYYAKGRIANTEIGVPSLVATIAFGG